MTESRVVGTMHGDARIVRNRSRNAVATLLLGHGAGGGIEPPGLAALAAHLPSQGVSVDRVEQPWRVAGKKIAPRPQVLDECFVDVARRLRTRTPLVVGGRSAGARSAARSAHRLGASGFLALAFPLHPPGHPDKSRLEEVEAGAGATPGGPGGSGALGGPGGVPNGRGATGVPGAG